MVQYCIAVGTSERAQVPGWRAKGLTAYVGGVQGRRLWHRSGMAKRSKNAVAVALGR
jgi:hypothetical protein